MHSANAKSNILLSWTHYKTLLQVEDEKARLWYEKETAKQIYDCLTMGGALVIEGLDKKDCWALKELFGKGQAYNDEKSNIRKRL